MMEQNKVNPEYRYAGKDYWTRVPQSDRDPQSDYVYNYVMFNDELWNIIGLVNVKTKSGSVEQRVKIVRNAKLEDDDKKYDYKWNENLSNDWTKSTLMNLLNGDYYNSQGRFSSTGLKEEARAMIDDSIVWNIGGWDTPVVLTASAYQYERGDQVSDGNPTTWPSAGDSETKARVGLPYPSDFGYAVGGSKEIRNQCLSEVPLCQYAVMNGDYTCGIFYNWISSNIWLISPSTRVDERNPLSRHVFKINPPAILSDYQYVLYTFYVRPTVYLYPSVLVSEGNGSYDTPYILEL